MAKISRLRSSSQVINADTKAMEEFSVPPEILMENAGLVCADFAASMTSVGDHVLIMAGVGNNGGDGMVMARHLDRMGRRAFVLIAGEMAKIKGPSSINMSILRSMGIPCVEMSSVSDDFIKDRLSQSSLVVDALLGTGSSGEPRGEVLRAVLAVDGFSPILSVDCPTGVNVDDGTVPGKAVRADLTVTMVSKKIGHEVFPGKQFCGRVELAHIGISSERLLECDDDSLILVDESYVGINYPRIPIDAHKYSRGGILVVAGSEQYPGAAALVARSALRAGAGLCVLAAPPSIRPFLSSLPEVIFESLDRPKDLDRVLERWSKFCSVTVIGSGMGRSTLSKEIFMDVFLRGPSSVVVDGDGLAFLPEAGLSRKTSIVITPHEGEAARLMGWNRDMVSQNRLATAGSLAGTYGVCLLKGPGSLVCSRSSRAVISSGNAALSVAGSGDVLAGTVGALWSRGCSPFDAAALGGWIHGRSGETLSCRSIDGVLASEIADGIPDVLGGFH